jgi:hypothetical protein
MKLLDEQLNCSLTGDFDKGWKICKKLEKLEKETRLHLQEDLQKSYIKYKQLEERNLNFIRARFNRGWYLMMHGDLLGGFTLMNEGRHAELWGNKHIGTKQPMWKGEDLNGKHILFVCEAGYGDQMLFVRFVKDISKRGGKVIVACDDYNLGSLFSKIQEVSAVINYQAALTVYHDYWIPSMAAPVALKTTYDDLTGLPYLKAKEEHIKSFESLIKSDKLKVGIRWLSMPKNGVSKTLGDTYIPRKFPSKLMFDAVMQDHVELYSLQRDEGIEDIPSSGVINLESSLSSWEHTAAIIANLDLVISSCTSVAHLSAAMGKPTWIIIPLMAYYTWALPGNKTPWYNSVKLFRQEIYGQWEEPFKKIKEDLQNISENKNGI